MHGEFGPNLVRLIGSWLLGVVVLQPITAGAQITSAPAIIAAQQISAQAQAENTGQDFVRPLKLMTSSVPFPMSVMDESVCSDCGKGSWAPCRPDFRLPPVDL